MLSGLQRPGAIPFLALVIFSLFSLVPSLSQQWDLYHWKFRRVSCLDAEAHGTADVLPLVLDRKLTFSLAYQTSHRLSMIR